MSGFYSILDVTEDNLRWLLAEYGASVRQWFQLEYKEPPVRLDPHRTSCLTISIDGLHGSVALCESRHSTGVVGMESSVRYVVMTSTGDTLANASTLFAGIYTGRDCDKIQAYMNGFCDFVLSSMSKKRSRFPLLQTLLQALFFK